MLSSYGKNWPTCGVRYGKRLLLCHAWLLRLSSFTFALAFTSLCTLADALGPATIEDVNINANVNVT